MRNYVVGDFNRSKIESNDILEAGTEGDPSWARTLDPGSKQLRRAYEMEAPINR